MIALVTFIDDTPARWIERENNIESIKRRVHEPNVSKMIIGETYQQIRAGDGTTVIDRSGEVVRARD